MNNNSLQDKLNQLKMENSIWILYVGIILLSWYSNSLEKDFLLNNSIKSKENYRKILIIIFVLLNFSYTYFLYDSYKSYKSLNYLDSDKKKMLNSLAFFASILISISGIILLYIALTDDDLNTEIAFN